MKRINAARSWRAKGAYDGKRPWNAERHPWSAERSWNAKRSWSARKLAMTIAAVLLIAALAMYALLMGGLIKTYAATDYTVTCTDPYMAYPHELNVGSTKALYLERAYAWTNINPQVLELDATKGLGDATLRGLRPGVTTVSCGTMVGQVISYGYKVVDRSNITQVTIAGGLEGNIKSNGGGLDIPIATVPAGAAGKITWVSQDTSIATVSGSKVTAKTDSGSVMIFGTFTDPWGVEHIIPFKVVIGSDNSGNGGNGGNNGWGIHGPNGQWYKPVWRPPNVFEVVNDDGTSKQPPEFIYNENGTPGDGNDRPAHWQDGSFWVEDPPGSNIWKEVGDDGKLKDDTAINGGPDRKPGGGDDIRLPKPIPGLSETTPADTVLNINGDKWIVIKKVSFGGEKFAMLLKEEAISHKCYDMSGVTYEGSPLQKEFTDSYSAAHIPSVLMNNAVIPDLGGETKTSVSLPSGKQAPLGDYQKDIIFPLSYKEASDWAGSASSSKLFLNNTRWWLRTPEGDAWYYVISTDNPKNGSIINSPTIGIEGNLLAVRPAIWVRYE